MTHPRMQSRERQQGGTVVEFALASVVLLTLVLGIMDFGRMLFTWNSAVEATRFGARVAVVCTNGEADTAGRAMVLAKMKLILPQLQDSNLVITWYDPEGVANPACNKASCKGVQVSLYNNAANAADPNNLKIVAISPFMGFVMPPIPAFPLYLPRESMEKTSSAGDSNPVCL